MKNTAQPYKITYKKCILTYNNDKIMREGLISDEESVELWGEEKDRGSRWFKVRVVDEWFGGVLGAGG